MLAMDINKNFKLSSTQFQSMCSGEGLQIAVKNKIALQIEKWKTGNNEIEWI